MAVIQTHAKPLDLSLENALNLAVQLHDPSKKVRERMEMVDCYYLGARYAVLLDEVERVKQTFMRHFRSFARHFEEDALCDGINHETLFTNFAPAIGEGNVFPFLILGEFYGLWTIATPKRVKEHDLKRTIPRSAWKHLAVGGVGVIRLDADFASQVRT